MDSRLWHCGGANCSESPRRLLVVSFARRGSFPVGSTYCRPAEPATAAQPRCLPRRSPSPLTLEALTLGPRLPVLHAPRYSLLPHLQGRLSLHALRRALEQPLPASLTTATPPPPPPPPAGAAGAAATAAAADATAVTTAVSTAVEAEAAPPSRRAPPARLTPASRLHPTVHLVSLGGDREIRFRSQPALNGRRVTVLGRFDGRAIGARADSATYVRALGVEIGDARPTDGEVGCLLAHMHVWRHVAGMSADGQPTDAPAAAAEDLTAPASDCAVGAASRGGEASDEAEDGASLDAAPSADDTWSVVCEDDARLCDGFFERLEDIASSLHARHPTPSPSSGEGHWQSKPRRPPPSLPSCRKG